VTARRARVVALLAVALAGVVLPACGGDGDDAAPADCEVLRPGPDGTTEATIVGQDLGFDVSCLEVRPGRLELTFENRDEGVLHDLRVTGHGVNAATDLVAGTTTQRLTVDLAEPGRYTFACDPHATMEGTLVVAEPGGEGDGSGGGG
jgi:plastocyanin